MFHHINLTHTHTTDLSEAHPWWDCFSTSQRCSAGLRSGDGESQQHVTSLRSPELCDVAHYPALKVAIRHRNGRGPQQYLGRLLHLNDVQLLLMGPIVGRAYIPDPIRPPLLAWTKTERLDWLRSCCLFQILTLPSESCQRNQDSSDQETFFQSSLVLGQLEPQASVPNWQKWSSGLVLLKAICFKIWHVVQSRRFRCLLC